MSKTELLKYESIKLQDSLYTKITSKKKNINKPTN